MKIIKCNRFKIFALDHSIRHELEAIEVEDRFEKIFDGNKRIYLPIKNTFVKNIADKLRSGETNTGNKYFVDIENKVAYRESDVENKRPFKLGKLIKNELGSEYLDQWSKYAGYDQKEDLIAIISTSPIDIARMSDFEKIQSCHSPDGAYFPSAFQEAVSGGAVAYVVNKNELMEEVKIHSNKNDINEISDKDIQDYLNENEIFFDGDVDEDMYVGGGIKPVSRTRILRYENTIRYEDLAVPINAIYGEEVSGFYESLRDFFLERQGIDEEKANDIVDDLRAYAFYREGGEYSDAMDKNFFSSFFEGKVDEAYLEEIPDQQNQGNRSAVFIWSEEVQSFLDDKFYFSNPISAEVKVKDGELYIEYSIEFDLDLRFNPRKTLQDYKSEIGESNFYEKIKDVMYIPNEFFGDSHELNFKEEINGNSVTLYLDVFSKYDVLNADELTSRLYSSYGDEIGPFDNVFYSYALLDINDLYSSINGKEGIRDSIENLDSSFVDIETGDNSVSFEIKFNWEYYDKFIELYSSYIKFLSSKSISDNISEIKFANLLNNFLDFEAYDFRVENKISLLYLRDELSDFLSEKLVESGKFSHNEKGKVRVTLLYNNIEIYRRSNDFVLYIHVDFEQLVKLGSDFAKEMGNNYLNISKFVSELLSQETQDEIKELEYAYESLVESQVENLEDNKDENLQVDSNPKELSLSNSKKTKSLRKFNYKKRRQIAF